MLGKYDFVNKFTAGDNESAARFSIELAVVRASTKLGRPRLLLPVLKIL